MILQRRLTRLYRISWKHQGRSIFGSIDLLAGRRRLRFSFFANEPRPGIGIQEAGIGRAASVLSPDY
jgi:hypothetical protein